MKHPPLPHRIHAFTAIAIAAAGLMLSSGVALAQTTRTIKGHFHSTDGNHGTYIETIATNGDTETKTVVYTRNSDKETSTDITTTVKSDESRTVAFSHTDYGSTAEFTSNKTVNKVKGGFIGTGTYTDAKGVSGTLKSLETSAADVNSKTTQYTPTGGAASTTDLRVEEDALDFVAEKVLTLEADGTTKSVIRTRLGRE